MTHIGCWNIKRTLVSKIQNSPSPFRHLHTKSRHHCCRVPPALCSIDSFISLFHRSQFMLNLWFLLFVIVQSFSLCWILFNLCFWKTCVQSCHGCSKTLLFGLRDYIFLLSWLAQGWISYRFILWIIHHICWMLFNLCFWKTKFQSCHWCS